MSRIRVGIGGWTFEPWRDNFYPKGLPHARELQYAAGKVTAIEVNGTYYSTMKPATFAKWRDETPDDFVFSLKANKFTTNRRVLAEAGESVERFIASGLAELGPKLGPVLWQFAPSKKFDPVDFEAFLKLLPAKVDGLPLRHVMDVRHDSFKTPEYLALARRHQVGTVFTDSDDYPSFADVTGDFIYVRTMRAQSSLPQGYEPQVLESFAGCVRAWAQGDEPEGLPRVEPPRPSGAPRDVFFFFISAAKERNPAAAMGLLERLSLV
ncbi:DUF72 domain-containing protein [Piscinibacter sp. HJYY11]|uniref:DUF72 domain-containing protein n=1 Tax=Piscinibacter sp. HJYY11 TaxID=2801333 RepID=UPI002873B6B8|nr:DUF72 domain-containing protein [Piscinibacter sp. HJYY11]